MVGAPETVARMKKVVSLIRQARDLTAQGPLDYYLEKLVDHSEALLTRFAPFKLSQKVVISKQVPCTGGWSGRTKTLAVGAVGTIQGVDFEDGKFTFMFLPDEEWWQHGDKEWRLAENRHTYSLNESYLSPYVKEDASSEGE